MIYYAHVWKIIGHGPEDTKMWDIYGERSVWIIVGRTLKILVMIWVVVWMIILSGEEWIGAGVLTRNNLADFTMMGFMLYLAIKESRK